MTDQESEDQVVDGSANGDGTGNEDKKEEKTYQAPKTPTTNDAINGSLDEIEDADTLKVMVRSLRAENGNARKKNKAMEEDLASLQAWKMDHLKGVADAEEKVAKADQTVKRYIIKAVAKEFDIDDDLIDLVDGRTEEEIWARGEKLANTKKKDSGARNPLDPGWVPGPTQLMPGKRGNPLNRPTDERGGDDSDWLKAAWDRF